MKTTRIHNRQGLVNWLIENAPTHTTRRLVKNGCSITLLGFFAPLPNSSYPGWIVLVQSSITSTVWRIAISSRPREPFHTTWLADETPWLNWVGGSSLIFQGDDNESNKRKHELALIEKGKDLLGKENGPEYII